MARTFGRIFAGRGSAAPPAGFFAATGGSATGDGTIGDPWDLQTALDGGYPAETVQPGDNVWLRGGTYTGKFTGNLDGDAGHPIIVRQYPGERAILDGNYITPYDDMDVLTVEGSYTWYWGFEITHSGLDQSTDDPYDLSQHRTPKGAALALRGPYTKAINLITHDVGAGFNLWEPATGGEIYGCLSYYNGTFCVPPPPEGLDRFGQGIYAQSQAGDTTRSIRANIFLDSGALAMQTYGSSGAPGWHNLVEKNIYARNGTTFGGLAGFSMADAAIRENYAWDSNSEYGYYSETCTDYAVTDNYMVMMLNTAAITGPYSALCKAAITISGNTVVGGVDAFVESDFPDNTYYTKVSPPTTNFVIVIPNEYETGRGHIGIWNWEDSAAVAVDLSSVLNVGESYEIRNAADYFGTLAASGTYGGGTVNLSTQNQTTATPVAIAQLQSLFGWDGWYRWTDNLGHQIERPDPRFGAFVVVKT